MSVRDGCANSPHARNFAVSVFTWNASTWWRFVILKASEIAKAARQVLKKLVAVLVSLLSIAVVVVLVVTLARIPVDISRYLGLIERQARQALGRRVSVEGEVIVTTSLWPHFELAGLRVASAPDPSSYRQPGRHLGHSLFSRERARGSRTRVIAVQSARTPLNIWSAWNSVGYSLETTTKDLQVDQCKRDLSKLDGHRLVQCM